MTRNGFRECKRHSRVFLVCQVGVVCCFISVRSLHQHIPSLDKWPLVFLFVVVIIIMDPSEQKASALYEALRSKAEVCCSNRWLCSRGAVVVSVGLQLNQTLLNLTLRWNAIGGSRAAAIAEALKGELNTPAAESFVGSIGDSGAAAIAEVLKVSSTLPQLKLESSCICALGATAIGEALKVNSSLQVLFLTTTTLEIRVPWLLQKDSR
jgi:hypothetical protein